MCARNRAFVAFVLGVGIVVTVLWLSETSSPMHAGGSGGLTVCPAGPPDCGYDTIQAAVDAAIDGDVIMIARGIYTGVQARGAPIGYQGATVITQVVYLTKSVTLRGGYDVGEWTIHNPDTNPTIIDAEGDGRGLTIAESITLTIEGMRVTNGNAAGMGGGPRGAEDVGGGIYVLNATVTLRDNKVYSNTAEHGGGMFLSTAPAVLSGNAIYSNTATQGGGLYLITSTAILSDNQVLDNAAAIGGGIYLDNSDVSSVDSTLVHNTATIGGGVYITGGTVALSQTTVLSNATSSSGGGIASQGSILTIAHSIVSGNHIGSGSGGGMYVTESTLDISHSTINRNHSGADGGGLSVQYDCAVSITNTTLSENTADQNGGGMHLDRSRLELTHSTIAGNRADYDGNSIGSGSSLAFKADSFNPITAVFTNTIIAAGGYTDCHIVGDDAYVMLLSGGYNLVQNPGVCAFAATGDITGTDPLLAPLADNGGPTTGSGQVIQTHALLSGSPAIDSGICAGMVADQRDLPRPVDMPDVANASDGCDIGAFEAQPRLFITKTADHPGSPVRPGMSITYTLTLTNDSAYDATGLVITDAVPAGASYVSGGTLMPGNVVSWTVSSLGGSASAQVQFVITSTETVTNSLYGAACAEGTSTAGTEAVVTSIEWYKLYLPLVTRSYVPVPAFAYGIEAHVGGDLPQVVNAVQDLGLGWLKHRVLWSQVEQSKGSYDWSDLDALADACHNAGIKVLFTVSHTPTWACGGKSGVGPPDNYQDFWDFAGAMAAHFEGRVHAYQIWDGQNLKRNWEWVPLSAADYMSLLTGAYQAIKAADPGAMVISGAPTPTGVNDGTWAIDDRTYLQLMYDAGLEDHSDGIGAYPMGFANPPDVYYTGGDFDPSREYDDHRTFFFRNTMEDYYQIMAANGDGGKRIWITRFGWGTVDGMGVDPSPGWEYTADIDEAQQADYIVRAYIWSRTWGHTGPMFLFNLNLWPVAGAENEMAKYSIVRDDWSPRPAYIALKNLPK